MNEKIENELISDELSEKKLNARQIIKDSIKDMWFIVGFCIVGWSVFCYGVASNGVLALLIGSAIMAFPSLKSYWLYGIGGVFAAPGVKTFATTSSGKKYRTNATGDIGVNIALKLLMLIIMAVVGVLFTIIRIIWVAVKCFIYMGKHQDIKLAFKDSIWLPLSVGMGSFILVPVIINLIEKLG